MPRVTITIPEQTPQPYRFSLDREVVKIGRSGENDIVIDSGSISGNHSEMRRVLGGYELVDLGSTNGTKLNDDRKEKIELTNESSVTLGDVDFGFSLTDEELEVMAKEKGPAKLPKAAVAAASPLVQELEIGEELEEPEGTNPLVGTIVKGLLILIFCIGAFFVGASVRHQKETGESLFKAMPNKAEQLQKAADKAAQ